MTTEKEKKIIEIKKEKLEKELEKITEGMEDNEGNKESLRDILGMGKISEQLIEDEKIKFLSNISPDMANDFAILYALDTKLNSPVLKAFLENKLILRTAIKGARAEDLIMMGKNIGIATALTLSSGQSILGEEKQGFLSKLREKI